MIDLFRTERAAVMALAMQQSTAWPVVFNAGSAMVLAEVAYDAVAPERFAARQTELLAANNRYLERARGVERGAARAAEMLETGSRILIAEDDIADALQTLEVARQVMRDVAADLRLAIAVAQGVPLQVVAAPGHIPDALIPVLRAHFEAAAEKMHPSTGEGC